MFSNYLVVQPLVFAVPAELVEVKAAEIWGAASVRGELQTRLDAMSGELVCVGGCGCG